MRLLKNIAQLHANDIPVTVGNILSSSRLDMNIIYPGLGSHLLAGRLRIKNAPQLLPADETEYCLTDSGWKQLGCRNDCQIISRRCSSSFPPGIR